MKLTGADLDMLSDDPMGLILLRQRERAGGDMSIRAVAADFLAAGHGWYILTLLQELMTRRQLVEYHERAVALARVWASTACRENAAAMDEIERRIAWAQNPTESPWEDKGEMFRAEDPIQECAEAARWVSRSLGESIEVEESIVRTAQATLATIGVEILQRGEETSSPRGGER